MRWNELIQNLPVLARGGDADPQISDVVYDSRRAAPGSVYVAIPGFKTHGDSFIADAAGRGAAAIVSGNPQPGCGVPWAQVKDPRSAVGLLSKALWGGRFDRISCIGITGTNGKTTTAYLFRQLLEESMGPDAVWMFSTVVCRLGKQTNGAIRTTPESTDIFRLLGTEPVPPQAIVMEVSSHSLELNRVAGLLYTVAVFTNLTQDHLDFHNTMEAYYRAKKKLFTDYLKPGGKAIINIDDQWGKRLASELKPAELITYGSSPEAMVRIADWKSDWSGSEIVLDIGGKTHAAKSKLVGAFNVQNMTALCAGAVALGIDFEKVQRMLAGFSPAPGRMEVVSLPAPFSVVVDYAHTPDALENVLSTARKLTKGRLICVFGCGGDRDRTKRPRMAEAVVRHCDEAVITSDNPRTEKPETIIEEIMAGVPLDFPHWVIADRRAAIAKALRIARAGDCVVIAGKGHEDYQEINGVKHHFSDREVVQEVYGTRDR